MVRKPAILQEDFDAILDWLNPDREVAGKFYLELRSNLERLFEWNRCDDSRELTDEVFDRITRKVQQVRQTYEGDPRRYFYGVARNLIRESSAKSAVQVVLEDIDPPISEQEETDELEVTRGECFQKCLDELDQSQRQLIVDYYSGERQAKIDQRKLLAEKQQISLETLRVRAFRLRATLQRCIEDCIKAAGQANEMDRPKKHYE